MEAASPEDAAKTTAAVPFSPAPSAGPPPARIGNHEVLAEIARGGMGVVYRARHATLGHEVALKVLSSPLASPAEVERFRLEASAAASMEHPGIVPVHDFGEHEGRPWLAMRLVPGG